MKQQFTKETLDFWGYVPGRDCVLLHDNGSYVVAEIGRCVALYQGDHKINIGSRVMWRNAEGDYRQYRVVYMGHCVPTPKTYGNW